MSHPKKIAFFNHKGGVGKTTIVFNLALALASKGQTVLLVDADAQANLTALALDETAIESAIEAERTIWSCFHPLVTGSGDLEPKPPVELRPKAVYLLPGDLRLSRFEDVCPGAWTNALAKQVSGFRITSAIYRLANSLARQVEADYVLIDLGPNVNALNRTALLASDAFVIPMAPDLFSVRALPSVGTSVATWSKEWKVAVQLLDQPIDFDLPDGKARPLGYVTQQFSVYRSSASAAFQKWIDEIPGAYQDGVIQPLADAGMSGNVDSPALASIPNFYSLVPMAQQANKAVFELSGTEARGEHYTRAQQTRKTFVSLADRIVALTART